MSNILSRAGHQRVAETPRQCPQKLHALEGQAGVSPNQDATDKATRRKWRERLQRELLKIWLAFSALWVGCVLAILGQCLYGRWLEWHLPQCDAPLVNPAQTYIADFATAFGPPAFVLLSYRVVIGASRRLRRGR